MKKTNLFIIVLTLAIFVPVYFVSAVEISLISVNALAERLSGKILLQVEDAGQAWYVDPETKLRAFLGRPDDAFRIMRELGLGISEANYNAFIAGTPKKFAGKIFLRVEANGEAYYVNPQDMKMHYLGRPDDAFAVMRELGLGITNTDLSGIEIHAQYQERIQEQVQEQKGQEEVTEEKSEGGIEGEQTEESGGITEEATTTEEVIENDATTTEEIIEETVSLGKSCEFTAEYFKNYDLTGKIAVKKEMGIDHDWGVGKPDEVYKNDKFSVRWSGNCEFEEGRYRFTGTFNDAVKATIDNATWIHNYWVNSTNGTSFEKELNISAGTHFIKVDYYDYMGDAVARLDWEKIN